MAQVSRLSVRAPVYNLEVEGAHEYFANGIAVHNSWRYPDAWDMLMFGLRAGSDPRVLVTTTPRPTKILRELVADPTTAVTRGSSYENRDNLAPVFFDRIVGRYAGTRLGRQELEAELLEDVPGALWKHELIEATRVLQAPQLSRVVVAIDPAASHGEDSDETGIIIAGRTPDGHGYVLADASGRMEPIEWARAAIAAYRAHRADRVVAEVNNGGEMVEATLRMVDPNVPFTAVHATRGKVVRAEPVAALYEQGRAHHVGLLAKLEDQMCAFTSDLDRKQGSPDRVDAAVWALTDLLVETDGAQAFYEVTRRAYQLQQQQIEPDSLADRNPESTTRARPHLRLVPKPLPQPAPGSLEHARMLSGVSTK